MRIGDHGERSGLGTGFKGIVPFRSIRDSRVREVLCKTGPGGREGQIPGGDSRSSVIQDLAEECPGAKERSKKPSAMDRKGGFPLTYVDLVTFRNIPTW